MSNDFLPHRGAGQSLVVLDSLPVLGLDESLELVNGVVKRIKVAEPTARPSTYHKFDKESGNWVLSEDSAWSMVRDKRDKLLQESDWTQLPDIQIATKDAWLEYRKLLRDITLQSNPFNIVWPSKPE